MSSSSGKGTARAPRRERGRRRVAALLEAAISLFAEKGYDAVTMTEVAAKAGAPIGSLYQFFPGKEALADAVIERFGERLGGVLEEIEGQAATLPVPALAEAMLGLPANFREERAAATALLESPRDVSALAEELKHAFRKKVARILRAANPALVNERSELMALVVIQLMKAAAQAVERDPELSDLISKEFQSLMENYLSGA